ncbi:MAG: FecR family protein [Bacteroidales bacterium]
MNSEQIASILTKVLFKQKTEIEEKAKLDRWIRSSEQNKSLYHFLNEEIKLATPAFYKEKEDRIRDRIMSEIDLESMRQNRFKRKFNAGKYWKYAAVFLIGLLVPASIWLTAHPRVYSEFEVPYGEVSELVLPDGSRVKINSGSKLIYQESFWTKDRLVDLTGEAYFEVKKSQNRSFTVSAKGANVEVLGTSFNVKAYPDDSFLEATLFTGSISFSAAGKDLKMKPNQQLVYDFETEGLTLDIFDKEDVNWMNGYYRLEQATLFEVTRLLAKIYDCQIEIDPDVLPDLHFSGYVDRNRTLEENIEIICLSTETNYITSGYGIRIVNDNPF